MSVMMLNVTFPLASASRYKGQRKGNKRFVSAIK